MYPLSVDDGEKGYAINVFNFVESAKVEFTLTYDTINKKRDT